MWQWTNYSGEPNTDISNAIFTENGTYADAWYGRLVSVGEWRETGDRSADLVIVTHELIALDELFGQSPVAVPNDLYEATPLTLWRIDLEFEETGQQFTATGTAETQDARGTVLESYPYAGIGARMTLASEPVAASQKTRSQPTGWTTGGDALAASMISEFWYLPASGRYQNFASSCTGPSRSGDCPLSNHALVRFTT